MASSFVCTSPLAVITVIGLLDVVTVSNSAEFKSFLLIMCVDAPESTTNSLSSCLIVDGDSRHQFSEGEKNVVSCFTFDFKIHLVIFHAASRAYRSCLCVSSWDRSSNFGALGLCWWGSPGQIMPSDVFGLECWRDVTRLWWIEHIFLASVCLSSSAKSMKTSAAPYVEIRNPIVVYSST